MTFINLLFLPASKLMDRMSFIWKYIVIFIVSGLMLCIFSYNLLYTSYNQISFANKEVSGLHVSHALHKLIQASQKHRGTSATYLSGDTSVKSKLDALTAEVKAAQSVVEDQMEPEMVRNERWLKVKSAIHEITTKGLELKQADNTKLHTELIKNQIYMLKYVAGEYGLLLDPDIASYYLTEMATLQLPVVLENEGILRALGSAVLTKKELTPEMRIQILSRVALLTHELDKYNNSIGALTSKLGSAADQYKNNSDLFLANTTAYIATIQEVILSEKFSMPASEYFAQATKTIDSGYNLVYETAEPYLEKQVVNRKNALIQESVFIISAALLLTLLTGYLAVGTLLSTLNSFKKMIENTHKIAEGDLTIQVRSHSNDEFKDVWEAINSMAQQMNTVVKTIQHTADAVNHAASETFVSSETIKEGSATQASAATSMAAAMEEMTVSINEISQNSDQAYDISSRTQELASNGAASVENMSHEMQDISNTVSRSASIIEELGKHSADIGQVVDVINEIAGQINLLALNAAIEAARAGEQGRGFAVVADEVRKLAEKTSGSTARISKVVETIKTSTADAVRSMHAGVETVDKGVNLAADAVQAMKEIHKGADHMVTVLSDISNALKEQSAASADIATSVERIAQMSESNSEAATNSLQLVKGLKTNSDELQVSVLKFKVD